MSRKTIRDHLAAAITAALPGTAVYPFSQGVHETADPFVSVYFNSGEVSEGMNTRDDLGQLFVVIMAPNDTAVDDTLDALAEPIDALIAADRRLNENANSTIATGWAYDRESAKDQGWTGLQLAYLIDF